jgi:hypothetical protein
MISRPAVFKRLGSRLGPAARLSSGPDPEDSITTAMWPVGSGNASAEDTMAVGAGHPGSSAAGYEPVATSADQAHPAADAAGCTGLLQTVQLPQPAAAAAAAPLVSTPLSGTVQNAAGAGPPAGLRIQPPAHPALSPVGEDEEEEEETVPLGHNPLARRVLAGRQSLVPSRHQVPEIDQTIICEVLPVRMFYLFAVRKLSNKQCQSAVQAGLLPLVPQRGSLQLQSATQTTKQVSHRVSHSVVVVFTCVTQSSTMQLTAQHLCTVLCLQPEHPPLLVSSTALPHAQTAGRHEVVITSATTASQVCNMQETSCVLTPCFFAR